MKSVNSKKSWTTPRIILLSSGNVESKTFPQVKEGTGNYFTNAAPQYKNFSNAANTFGINVTSNGVPVGGNKTQAFS